MAPTSRPRARVVLESLGMFRHSRVLLRLRRGRSQCTVPKDSGRIGANIAPTTAATADVFCGSFYMSAVVTARCRPASKAYRERKRAEGKSHRQAVIALAAAA